MKAEWRSASTMNGVLCVMTPGEVLMLLWCVDSWDTLLKVSSWDQFNLDTQAKMCFVPTDAVAFSGAHFSSGVGPIHLNNVACSGSETNLIDCSHSSTVSCNNGHSEDAGVRCQG